MPFVRKTNNKILNKTLYNYNDGLHIYEMFCMS